MYEEKIDEKSAQERHMQALDQAYRIHGELLGTITEMDNKIEEVIRSHQAQFLLAYRSHIKNMKEELAEIKARGQEQEKKIMSNERSVFLQKQIILFREEALRLYDKLDQKMQENEDLKNNYREIEKTNQILQRENREYLKEIKVLEAQKSLVQSQVKVLSDEKQALRQQLEAIKGKTMIKTKMMSQGQTSNTKNDIQGLPHKYSTPKNHSQYLPIGIISRKGTRKTQPKIRQLPGANLSLIKERKKITSQFQDFQIKNFFVQCIESIRKEVGQRKVYGGKTQDINNIGSWEEFRTIDKLRLLQMFMQNQKLLVWMYQKIFPSRMTQIENYLHPKSQSKNGYRSKTKSMQINIDGLVIEDDSSNRDSGKEKQSGVEIEMILPKVGSRLKKQKKYDVRGRIQMRNGKLSLSSINNDLS